MFQHVLRLACKDFIFLPISKLASIKELDNSVLLSKTELGKLKGHAPGEINLKSKQDLICHVAKVKFDTSTHSMDDLIPFQCIYYFLRIKSFQNTKRKYILHNKEDNIRNTVRVCTFQKLLANKHLRLRDSRPSGGLGLSTKLDYEPRSAHGCAVN